MPTSRAGSCNNRSLAGFTLAELLVALVIVSVMLALILPGVTSLLGDEKFRSAAGRLAEAFSRARLDAVMDGTRRRVVLDLDEGRFWVDRVPRPSASSGNPDDADARDQDPLLPPPVKRALPDGLRLAQVTVFNGDPVTSGRISVRVLPLGLSEPCSLVLADSGDVRRRLDVPATGAPAWHDGGGGDATMERTGP